MEKKLFSMKKNSLEIQKKAHQKEKNGQLVTNVSKKVLHCFPIQSVRQMTFIPKERQSRALTQEWTKICHGINSCRIPA
jgi:hypothetical protein